MLGGGAGGAAGSLVTAIYARARGWPVVIPALAWAGGIGATLFIGALAGLLPAIRATRQPDTITVEIVPARLPR